MMTEDFHNLIQRHIRRLNLSRSDLEKYLNGPASSSISSWLNPNEKKRPSPRNLKNLFLLLSQKDTSNVSKDLDTSSVVPSILLELVLASYDLGFFKDQFLEAEILTASDDLFEKELDAEKKVNETRPAEVWTISNVLAESIDTAFAKKTALNIVNNNVIYRNFVPLSDEDHWVIGRISIEKHMFDAVGGQTLELLPKHYKVYGISDVGVIHRMRIFHASSNNAKGNINIGGSTVESGRFVNLESGVLERIKTMLSEIVNREKIQELPTELQIKKGEKEYHFLKRYHCHCCIKYPTN